MFYGLVVHGKIMTNVERFRCNFTDNPVCSICGSCEESVSHVLRDCPVARHIWKQVWYPSTCISFLALHVSNWLRFGASFDSCLSISCHPRDIMYYRVVDLALAKCHSFSTSS